MQFSHITNAAVSQQSDRPLMQKDVYPVSTALQHYLQQYQRDIELPVTYKALFHYDYSNAIKDENGKHTHWERVVYEKELLQRLQVQLIDTYLLLKKSTTISAADIKIQSIDFCEFANSMPFRINLVNTSSNSHHCFYIKDADASRVYGLELEHLLSGNAINFFYHKNTLVEEHIEGVPGDVFLAGIHDWTDVEKKLLATEFVRFNERCFARLLGDMRSYNFVVIKNEDNPELPYHIRAIDFDQQCYEGKLNLYLPQFYKENYAYVQMAIHDCGDALIEETRVLARKEMAALAQQQHRQLAALLQAMSKEEISENYKVISLRKELNEYFATHRFSRCKTMGAIVKQQLKQLLQAHIGSMQPIAQ